MDKITSTSEDGRVLNILGPDADMSDIEQFVRENIDAWVGLPVVWNVDAFDFRGISGSDLQGFARSLVDIAQKRQGDKTAIVAGQDLPFGMMQVFTTYAETAQLPIQFRVFRSMSAASRWLDRETV
jgi:hypothetical protein